MRWFKKKKEKIPAYICTWCGCYYYTETGESYGFMTTPIIGAVEKSLCNACKKERNEIDEKRLKELGYNVVRVQDGWEEVE